MKNNFLIIALLAIFVGFSACGGKDTPKAKDCEITGVTDNGTYAATWSKGTGDKWIAVYCKTADLNRIVNVTISDKATGQSGSLNVQLVNGIASYTVTAEDGTTKTWTLTATNGINHCQ
jgi:hypothetical protein